MNQHLIRLPLACLILTLLAFAGSAQGTTRPIAQSETTPQDLLDLNFEGGTVAQYVKLIREKVPGVNIVVSDNASDVPMPPIRLTSVTLDMALWLLDGRTWTTGSQVVEVSLDQYPGDPTQGQKNVFYVLTEGYTVQKKSLVLSIMDLIEGGIDAENILTAIEMGLDMVSGSHTAATIRFHAETGILIAVGQHEQISIIEDIVNELYQNVRSQQSQINAADWEAKYKTLKETHEQTLADMEQLKQKGGIFSDGTNSHP